MSTLLAFSGTIATFITILWSLILVIVSTYSGWSLQTITGSKLDKFLKQINFCSATINGRPSGWCIGFQSTSYRGYSYIGVISVKSGESGSKIPSFTFIGNKKMFDDIEQEKKEGKSLTDQPLTKKGIGKIYPREGGVGWFDYMETNYHYKKLERKSEQQNAVEEIRKNFNLKTNEHDSGYCVSFIYGDPGSGKSMVAEFLVQDLLKDHSEVHFVDSYNPTDPGDNFAKLYNKIGPEKDSPLVILLDEIDILIEKIHYQRIEQHKNYVRQISDKCSWNKFFDEFDRLRYPYVYLVMTSNRSEKFISDLDASYIRPGRVDIKIKI